MYDFDEVIATTKEEQIRAWSVTKAIDSLGGGNRDGVVVKRAAEIENYVLNGTKED